MSALPPQEPKSFSPFSSAAVEAEWHSDDPIAAEQAKANRGRGGANGAPSEVTTLERRVLAHERILQALIGHLAADDPQIIEQLKARFGSGHDLGQYDQDFVSTDHYGDHFIRSIEVEIERRNGDRSAPSSS